MKKDRGMNKPAKDGSLGTREAILARALEIVNERGMTEFRVDALSSMLGLSPGNVTYHFAKKDDLSAALWQNFIREFRTLDVLISGLMDVKQAFLVFRSVCCNIYKYRGIVMFRGGDTAEPSLNEMLRGYVEVMLRYLGENGYLSVSEEVMRRIVVSNTVTQMRFWVNCEFVFSSGAARPEELPRLVDRNALLMLYSIYPLLNEKGIAEFTALKNKIL